MFVLVHSGDINLIPGIFVSIAAMLGNQS